jgi:hypothetical protein
MALSLRAAAGIVHRNGNPYQPDERVTAYHREMLAQFGAEVDEELLKRSPNIGYPQLCEEVLAALPVRCRDPDLLLLAYGLPDMFPLKSTTAHLNFLLGGGSRSFAVSEQGLRAPFTALRIADAYARSGRCASLALFICDQTTLPCHDPIVHDTPLVDSAVLLYFDDRGGGLAYQPGSRPDGTRRLGELLAAAMTGLDAARTLVVAGSWVDDAELAPAGPNVHRAAPGTYCTGVWLDLARHHEAWSRTYQHLVLCDTDPRSGRSQTAILYAERVHP